MHGTHVYRANHTCSCKKKKATPAIDGNMPALIITKRSEV